MKQLKNIALNCRIYCGVIIALVLASCSEASWDTLANAAAQACGNETACLLRLSDVYSFGWSAVYIFDRGTAKSVMEEIVGAKVPNYREFCQGMVFVGKMGEILSSEFSSCESDLKLSASNGSAVAEFLLYKEHRLYFRLTKRNSTLCANKDDSIYANRPYFGLTPCVKKSEISPRKVQ